MFPGRASLPAATLAALVLGSPGHADAAPPAPSAALDSLREQLFVTERFAAVREGCDALLGRLPLGSHDDSLAYVRVLDLRAQVDSADAGRIDSTSFARARRAVEFRERMFGHDAPEVFASLVRFGDLQRLRGRFADSRPTYERAIRLAVAIHGDSSLEVATASRQFGMTLAYLGELDAARAAWARAVAIQTRRLGPDDLEIALTMHARGALDDWGYPEAARENYTRALAIRRKHLPADSWPVGQSLANLSNQYGLLGDYDTALRLGEQALPIILAHPGPDSGRYALQLNNLATWTRRTGDYARTRALIERAMEIGRSVKGPGRAFILYAYAGVLGDMGEYDEARVAIDQCLASAGVGSIDANMSRYLQKRGSIQEGQGDTLGALHTYQRARESAEHDAKQAPARLALILAELGYAHLAVGDRDSASSYLEAARDLYARTGGERHADMGGILERLSRVLRAGGHPDSALVVAERSLEIRRDALGPWHPDVSESATELAIVLAELGRNHEALAQALASDRLELAHLRLTIPALSERQALEHAARRGEALDLAISIAATGAPAPEEIDSVFDEVIRGRAVVLDEMAGRHAAVVAPGDTAAARRLAEFAAARRRFANLALRGPASDRDTTHIRRLQAAQHEAEVAERLLEAGESARHRVPGKQAGLVDVRRSLDAGAVLVSYVEYRHRPSGKTTLGEAGWPEAYAAFVLAGHGPVTLVPLGTAAAVDPAIVRWRALVANDSGGLASERACRMAGLDVRRLIWDPVRRSLGSAREVFVVPDGEIHAVNLAALPAEGDGYLVESGPLLHLYSSERDLLVREAKRHPSSGGLLAIGGVDFDRARGSADAPARAHAVASAFRGPAPPCPDFRAMHFGPLPGSAGEAQAVSEIFRGARIPVSRHRVTLLEGAEASETAFKAAAPRHRFLHLATHGFFIDPACGAASTPANPLLRSGVVLAGANRRSMARADEDDGVLTAEEVAALDLSRTDWVVLSACQSGAGSLVSGEGVLGLQRAFRIAGAGTLVMSLWKVDDQTARRWMARLYDARFKRGEDASTAVRDACREFLRRQRELGESTHPASWGAFVASGD